MKINLNISSFEGTSLTPFNTNESFKYTFATPIRKVKGFQLKKAYIYSTFATVYPGHSRLYWFEKTISGDIGIYSFDFQEYFINSCDKDGKIILCANNMSFTFGGLLVGAANTAYSNLPANSTNTYTGAIGAEISSMRTTITITASNTSPVPYQFISDPIAFPASIHDTIGFNTGNYATALANVTQNSQPYYTSYLTSQTNQINQFPQPQFKNTQFYPGIGHILVDFVERRADANYTTKSWKNKIIGTFYGFDSGTYLLVQNEFDDVIPFDSKNMDLKDMSIYLVDHLGRQIAQMDNMPNIFEFIIYTE